ncbi:FeoA family protein [Halobacteriovorax sp. DA5]|uniref:FeoA family protein n=1 Tax=Halobacteriovorax sp. DA5 TaxID=2067553 RepID=UPI001304E61D|nr:FeoA family protein [Halobacteriovorax sp. DA5]
MVLSKVKKGVNVKILSFDKGLKHKTIMTGLGILPGDAIQVIAPSFLGSPLTLRLTDGETVALRLSEASLINVEELN